MFQSDSNGQGQKPFFIQIKLIVSAPPTYSYHRPTVTSPGEQLYMFDLTLLVINHSCKHGVGKLKDTHREQLRSCGSSPCCSLCEH